MGASVVKRVPAEIVRLGCGILGRIGVLADMVATVPHALVACHDPLTDRQQCSQELFGGSLAQSRDAPPKTAVVPHGDGDGVADLAVVGGREDAGLTVELYVAGLGAGLPLVAAVQVLGLSDLHDVSPSVLYLI